MRYGKYVLALVVAIAGCQGFCRQEECPRDGHGNGVGHGVRNTLPPASMLMHPGPGVDGPGPGVMMYQPAAPMPAQALQVAFTGPDGMVINWDVGAPACSTPSRWSAPAATTFRKGRSTA